MGEHESLWQSDALARFVGYTVGFGTFVVLTFPMDEIPFGSVWLCAAAGVLFLVWLSVALILLFSGFAHGCKPDPVSTYAPRMGTPFDAEEEEFLLMYGKEEW